MPYIYVYSIALSSQLAIKCLQSKLSWDFKLNNNIERHDAIVE